MLTYRTVRTTSLSMLHRSAYCPALDHVHDCWSLAVFLCGAEERVYAEIIVHGGGEPELSTQSVDKQLETARCASSCSLMTGSVDIGLRIPKIWPATVCDCRPGQQLQLLETPDRRHAYKQQCAAWRRRYIQQRRNRVRERQAELVRERSPPLMAAEERVSALHQFLAGSVRHRVCTLPCIYSKPIIHFVEGVTSCNIL